MTITEPVPTTYAVVGVFTVVDRAEAAVNGLRDAGFAAQDVSVVAKDHREARDITERADMTDEGSASGAVTGGLCPEEELRA